MSTISAFRVLVLGTAIVFCCATASAGGSANNVTIAETEIFPAYGNFVFIRLNAASTGAPSCSTNTYWHFTMKFDGVAGREQYSTLLAAAAAGKQIIVNGTGACSEHSAVESLLELRVLW
jgi:hypothetical protein